MLAGACDAPHVSLTVDTPGGRFGGTAVTTMGVTVIVAEHCGMAGAVLSTLPSLAHIIFITTSEVSDIVVTVL